LLFFSLNSHFSYESGALHEKRTYDTGAKAFLCFFIHFPSIVHSMFFRMTATLRI
jgi:hypothetical protein